MFCTLLLWYNTSALLYKKKAPNPGAAAHAGGAGALRSGRPRGRARWSAGRWPVVPGGSTGAYEAGSFMSAHVPTPLHALSRNPTSNIASNNNCLNLGFTDPTENDTHYDPISG